MVCRGGEVLLMEIFHIQIQFLPPANCIQAAGLTLLRIGAPAHCIQVYCRQLILHYCVLVFLYTVYRHTAGSWPHTIAYFICMPHMHAASSYSELTMEAMGAQLFTLVWARRALVVHGPQHITWEILLQDHHRAAAVLFWQYYR